MTLGIATTGPYEIEVILRTADGEEKRTAIIHDTLLAVEGRRSIPEYYLAYYGARATKECYRTLLWKLIQVKFPDETLTERRRILNATLRDIRVESKAGQTGDQQKQWTLRSYLYGVWRAIWPR